MRIDDRRSRAERSTSARGRQAAIPTAVNTTILALEFDTWPQIVGNVGVATMIRSLLTLTLLLVFLR